MAQVVDPVLGIFRAIMSHSVGNMESEFLVSLVPVMYDPDWGGGRDVCNSFVCCV